MSLGSRQQVRFGFGEITSGVYQYITMENQSVSWENYGTSSVSRENCWKVTIFRMVKSIMIDYDVTNY